jgi:hypothetical protein
MRADENAKTAKLGPCDGISGERHIGSEDCQMFGQNARGSRAPHTFSQTPAPADTMDAMMANRIMSRLSNTSATPASDRQFMRAEVMMRQHMAQADDASAGFGHRGALIDQTIPIVQQHLALVQSVWSQVGGGMDNGSGTSQ